jgi:hypothetical protein
MILFLLEKLQLLLRALFLCFYITGCSARFTSPNRLIFREPIGPGQMSRYKVPTKRTKKLRGAAQRLPATTMPAGVLPTGIVSVWAYPW